MDDVDGILEDLSNKYHTMEGLSGNIGISTLYIYIYLCIYNVIFVIVNLWRYDVSTLG